MAGVRAHGHGGSRWLGLELESAVVAGTGATGGWCCCGVPGGGNDSVKERRLAAARKMGEEENSRVRFMCKSFVECLRPLET